MSWRRHPGLAATTLVAAVLAACGGGDEPPRETEAAPGEPPAQAQPPAPSAPGPIPGSGPAPAQSCDRVASPSGDDGATGTPAAPFRTAERLVESLSFDQTGCLRSGTFSFAELRVTRPGVTLTSYPGERATLRGHLWIDRGAAGVTVSHLDLDGRGPGTPWGPRVNAPGVVFDDVDVTNRRTEICFLLGSRDYARADGTVIQNSRIHDCGRFPPTNRDHGVYVAQADDVVIRGNWIYDNADRGVQLYPDAQGAEIYGNVIDGNGEGVIFSGDAGTVSSDNVVRNNVISNSRVRWNLDSYWPTDRVGSGNVARDNCLWGGNPEPRYNRGGGVIQPSEPGKRGFATSGNVIAPPRFVDPGRDDFRVRPASRCAPLLAG